jgi:hypothetical protein
MFEYWTWYWTAWHSAWLPQTNASASDNVLRPTFKRISRKWHRERASVIEFTRSA